jgi:Ca2+-binding EF-hand superfamily protein
MMSKTLSCFLIVNAFLWAECAMEPEPVGEGPSQSQWARVRARANGLKQLDLEHKSLNTKQLADLHSRLDANGDGQATLQEINEYAKNMRIKITSKGARSVLKGIDADEDGFVSLAEMMSEATKNEHEPAQVELQKSKFTIADRDKDGKLSEKEFAAFSNPDHDPELLELDAKDIIGQRDKNGDAKLSAEEWFHSGPVTDFEKAEFAKLDGDGDKALNPQEIMKWESGQFHMQQTLKQLLEITDKNKDGSISASELLSAREALAGSDANWHFKDWVENDGL